MKKTLLFAILICSLGGALIGCQNAAGQEKGYTPKDFEKRPPPPEYLQSSGAAGTEKPPEKPEGN